MFIPLDQLKHRRIYRVQSRNLVVGVWDDDTQGFVGLREKFGSRYLFTEYHWDHDPYDGTAQAVEALDMLPELISEKAYFVNDAPHKVPVEENLPLFWLLDELDKKISEELEKEFNK